MIVVSQIILICYHALDFQLVLVHLEFHNLMFSKRFITEISLEYCILYNLSSCMVASEKTSSILHFHGSIQYFESEHKTWFICRILSQFSTFMHLMLHQAIIKLYIASSERLSYSIIYPCSFNLKLQFSNDLLTTLVTLKCTSSAFFAYLGTYLGLEFSLRY
jgi:hypothetical protein